MVASGVAAFTRVAKRAAKTQLCEELRPLRQLGFSGDGFSRKRLGKRAQLRPAFVRQRQCKGRKHGNVAHLRVPFAAIEDSCLAHARKIRRGQRLCRAQDHHFPHRKTMAKAAPMQNVAGTPP